MLSRLLNLLALDARVMWRYKFVHVVVLVVLVLIILVNFIIPKEAKVGVTEYVVDATPSGVFASYLAREIDSNKVVATEEELLNILAREPNSIGIILQGSTQEPQAKIITQGHEYYKSIKLLEVSLDQLWVEGGGVEREKSHTVSMLRPEAAKIPFNKSLLPLIIALEVVLLGFYFAVVMVFQEKDEGYIRAYRISPGGTWEYIISKTLVNTGLALAYGTALVVATLGFDFPLLPLWGLIALVTSLMTLLGLTIGVFFKNLSAFIYPALGVTTLMTIPLATYFFPAFTLPIITMIPTYPLMFGLREILFTAPRPELLAGVVQVLLPQLVIVALLAYLAVEKRLMQEVK